MNVPLVTSDSVATDEQFWHAVLLYHNRPHLVNRRLIGVSQALFVKVDFVNNSIKQIKELFTRSAILYEVRKLKELSKGNITLDFVRNILEPYDKDVGFDEVPVEDLLNDDEGVYISVRILLPRQGIDKCLEVVIFDLKVKTCTFYGVTEFEKKALAPPFPYDIQLTSGYTTVCLLSFEDAETASAEWLVEQLFLKLMKWIDNYKPEVAEVKHSLALVSLEEYTNTYQRLKEKYGKQLIDAWPEKTDPLKFVYEDVAIASYLITLWKSRVTKPTFVDLGCGNGLLVYILNEEGYQGEGIDVRKRKIWDWYPDIALKVESITPSTDCVFPNADWIIGNHSDELTPWIPVITALSSYKCNFFLLPCCAYEFNGDKYKRKDTSVSVYTDYMNYVQGLCKICGFEVGVDKLRIPSTKRTCIVTLGRTYKEDEFVARKQHISAQFKTADVQTRPATEKVRNCTQLNKDFLATIVREIVLILLSEKQVVGVSWNKGTAVTLPKLAESVGKESLKNLKSECGGLQTLLKNHRYIFDVGQGYVKLRLPATATETKLKYKSKLCWFHRNHPDGCLHNESVCAYLH